LIKLDKLEKGASGLFTTVRDYLTYIFKICGCGPSSIDNIARNRIQMCDHNRGHT
jgi:hypothetical protein